MSFALLAYKSEYYIILLHHMKISIQHIYNQIRLLYGIVFFFFVLVDVTIGQTIKNESQNPAVIGISVQLYPGGLMATLHSDIFLSANSSLLLRAGGNFTDRKDFSKYNHNERGAGFGGSIGFRKHFFLQKGQFIAGLNADLWNLEIKWKNDIDTPVETQGKTKILVFQPWLEAGYFTGVKKSPFQFGFTGGFGREINIITKGKEVGHGWIGSVTIYSSILFKSQS
ncbi:MAG: hypothetical protein ABIQ02_10015 [Saprospiraceae bacterium]